MDIGRYLSFFGDGYQSRSHRFGRDCWEIPVMDGVFIVEGSVLAVRGVGGGNLLICGPAHPTTLRAATHAVDAIAPIPQVITPFPGGVCRSGSKVGSRYKNMFASTNEIYCPTLRDQVSTRLPPDTRCVYEIVIDGLTRQSVTRAMRAGILAATQTGDTPDTDPSHIISISAGNYAGTLGDIKIGLHEALENALKDDPGSTPSGSTPS